MIATRRGSVLRPREAGVLPAADPATFRARRAPAGRSRRCSSDRHCCPFLAQRCPSNGRRWPPKRQRCRFFRHRCPSKGERCPFVARRLPLFPPGMALRGAALPLRAAGVPLAGATSALRAATSALSATCAPLFGLSLPRKGPAMALRPAAMPLFSPLVAFLTGDSAGESDEAGSGGCGAARSKRGLRAVVCRASIAGACRDGGPGPPYGTGDGLRRRRPQHGLVRTRRHLPASRLTRHDLG